MKCPPCGVQGIRVADWQLRGPFELLSPLSAVHKAVASCQCVARAAAILYERAHLCIICSSACAGRTCLDLTSELLKMYV